MAGGDDGRSANAVAELASANKRLRAEIGRLQGLLDSSGGGRPLPSDVLAARASVVDGGVGDRGVDWERDGSSVEAELLFLRGQLEAERRLRHSHQQQAGTPGLAHNLGAAWLTTAADELERAQVWPRGGRALPDLLDVTGLGVRCCLLNHPFFLFINDLHISCATTGVV